MKYLLILATFFATTLFILKTLGKSKNKTIPMRKVAKLNLTMPFLGLGTVGLGRDGVQYASESATKKVFTAALRKGLTVIDSAVFYPLSQERIGRYISRHNFNYLLITKLDENNITENIEASLKKLKTKKIDIALLHLQTPHASEVLLKGEAYQTLKTLQQAGKINYIGISTHSAAAELAINQAEWDFIELEYNLLNQTNKPIIELAYSKGMGVLVRGGLGSGLLTAQVASKMEDPNFIYRQQIKTLLELVNNDYDQLTALALAFLYSNSQITTVLIGADKVEYIRKNIKLLKELKDNSLLKPALLALEA